MSLTFVYLQQKATNAGTIKGNTTVGTSIYGNINKKASKLRHAMASQGRQGKPSKAKPGIDDKSAAYRSLKTSFKKALWELYRSLMDALWTPYKSLIVAL